MKEPFLTLIFQLCSGLRSNISSSTRSLTDEGALHAVASCNEQIAFPTTHIDIERPRSKRRVSLADPGSAGFQDPLLAGFDERDLERRASFRTSSREAGRMPALPVSGSDLRMFETARKR